MVVGHVQNTEVRVARQHGHTLICQPVVGQVELLQDAVALLRQAGRRQVLQLVGRHVHASQAESQTESTDSQSFVFVPLPDRVTLITNFYANSCFHDPH